MSALDTTRRALLAGAAVAGAELLPYARKPDAMPIQRREDPVLALRHAWEEAEARVDAAQSRLDAASAGYKRPVEPDAVCWRDSDINLFGDTITGHPEVIEGGKPSGRRIFSSPRDIDAFRIAAEQLRLVGDVKDRSAIINRQINRLDEIIASHEAWKLDVRARWTASGMGDAEQAVSEAVAVAKAVRLQIVRTPASSLEGALFKVQAAARCFGDDIGSATDALWFHGMPTGAGEDLAVSAFLDLMRLGDEARATQQQTSER